MFWKSFSAAFLKKLGGWLLVAFVVICAGCEPDEETGARSPTPGAPPITPAWASRIAVAPSIKLSSANSFEGISEVGNAQITQTPEGLQVHAFHFDPQMLLPRLQLVGNSKWMVHVQIFSPVDTAIQIYYDTTKHPQFDDAHSIRKPIKSGENDVTMEITNSDFGGNIRLDPGDPAGEYLIRLIEVQPIALDSSSPSQTARP
jgi:hypothetical protein